MGDRSEKMNSSQNFENTSNLLNGLKWRDVYDDNDARARNWDVCKKGATFDVEVPVGELTDSDNEEDGMFSFQNEMDLNQFFCNLSTEEKAKVKDSWKKPFADIEKDMIELTPDKGVLKKEIKVGYGRLVPERSQVNVHYNMFLEKAEDPFDSTGLRSAPMKLIVSENSMISGFDIAIASMKKGEVSEFLIKPEYAFGQMGCPPRIPKNATIFVTIELISFIESAAVTEMNSMTGEEQAKAPFPKVMEACLNENHAGNSFFKANEIHKALSCYQRALRLLEKVNFADQQEEDQAHALLTKLYSNASLCCLKTKRPQLAIVLSKKCLHIDGNHSKSLYCMGKALRVLKDYDTAKKYLIRASRKAPDDNAISSELNLLKREEQDYKTATKIFCQRMFGNYVATDSEKNTQPILVNIPEKFKANMTTQLQEFKDNDKVTEIPFVTGFSETELACIAQIALDLGLDAFEPNQGDIKLKVVKKSPETETEPENP